MEEALTAPVKGPGWRATGSWERPWGCLHLQWELHHPSCSSSGDKGRHKHFSGAHPGGGRKHIAWLALSPAALTPQRGSWVCRGNESRPRQLSIPVTGWQPITGPSPGAARSEVRPQRGVCAVSLNPRGTTCWACSSTAGT